MHVSLALIVQLQKQKQYLSHFLVQKIIFFCSMFLTQDIQELPKFIKVNNFYLQQKNFGINYLNVRCAESYPSYGLQFFKRNGPIHKKFFQLSIKTNNIHDIDLSIITKSISFASVFLTRLQLKNINLSIQSMTLIKQANWKFVKAASFNNNSITWEAVKVITECNWNYMRILQLSENSIKNKGIQTLCKIDWPNLRHLQLQNCKLDNNSLKVISKGIINKLTSLNMQDNYIDKDCFKYLVTANIDNLRQFLIESKFVEDKYSAYTHKLPFSHENNNQKQGILRMVDSFVKRQQRIESFRLRLEQTDDHEEDDIQ